MSIQILNLKVFHLRIPEGIDPAFLAALPDGKIQ